MFTTDNDGCKFSSSCAKRNLNPAQTEKCEYKLFMS